MYQRHVGMQWMSGVGCVVRLVVYFGPSEHTEGFVCEGVPNKKIVLFVLCCCWC